MNERQKRFCDEYIITLNAIEAYQKVYGKKELRTASAAASRLLSNVSVAKYMQEQINKERSDKVAQPAEVLEKLTQVLRDENAKTCDLLRAAEILCRVNNLYNSTQQVNATVVFTGEDDLDE